MEASSPTIWNSNSFSSMIPLTVIVLLSLWVSSTSPKSILLVLTCNSGSTLREKLLTSERVSLQ